MRQEGFAWRNERPQADAAGSRQHEKWGWIGERPGAWAELEVDTSSELQVPQRSGRYRCYFLLRAISACHRMFFLSLQRPAHDLCAPARPSDRPSPSQGELRRDANEVLLAHLRSYQHNGRARVECVAGCT